MRNTKTVLMCGAAIVALWLIATVFTHLAPPGAGRNGTLDDDECGMGSAKYDC